MEQFIFQYDYLEKNSIWNKLGKHYILNPYLPPTVTHSQWMLNTWEVLRFTLKYIFNLSNPVFLKFILGPPQIPINISRHNSEIICHRMKKNGKKILFKEWILQKLSKIYLQIL